MGLECLLGNIIKGNEGDSFAEKQILKNPFRTGQCELSNANALV